MSLTLGLLSPGSFPRAHAGTVNDPATATHGIPAPRHWAFEPISDPAPPRISPAEVRTPIDAFLLAQLRATPADVAPRADRRTLIRRVTYDLTGLPPTPPEVDAFVSDASPGAFAAVVGRLLASPAYGERWGRKWLDVVRYADTAGENSDHPAPHAWRYRNWVIDAFNRDLPYDEFLRQQIAGDLIAAGAPPQRRADLVIATGYLAIARRFGHDTDKDMHLTHEDVIDTVGKSVLGLTLGCARCHDHKYDPVSMKDYYGLYGIFASTRFSFPGCEPKQQPRDLVPLIPQAEADALIQPWRDSLAQLDAELKANTNAPDRRERQSRRDLLAAQEPRFDVAYAAVEGTPADAKLQRRGDPEQPSDAVPRKNLTLLGGQPLHDPETSGRLELARWLTDPANPLTARVMANRIWQGHFGVGLVTTPNDFGTRGAPPSNPRLLDHLASAFIRSGWSVKALHREILLSAAYQRASSIEARPTPTATQRPAATTTTVPTLRAVKNAADDTNTFPRRRLEAEEIRDTLLTLSGDLDPTPGAAHPFPPEKDWSFTQHSPFKAIYESNRRSVYLMTQRIQRHPFLALFDGPDPNASTPHRDSSTVPTQALYFLNDPFFHARSEGLAKRLLALPEQERIPASHRWCFQRKPTPEELKSAARFLADYRRALDGTAPEQIDLATWSAYARTLLASSELLHLD